MRMSRELYAKFAAAVLRRFEQSPTAVAWHKAEYSPERFRWNVLWACPESRDLTQAAYREGLADSHIDTALRSAVKDAESVPS